MNKTEAITLTAQAWCHPTTENLQMDTILGEVFADILMDQVNNKKQDMAKDVNSVTRTCHELSTEAGWWANVNLDDPLTVPAKMCLIHSEISEAMEGHRKDLMDDHLPHRKMVEVELADALIRIADLSAALGLDLGGAVLEKLAYNKQRADHKLENRAKSGGKAY